MFKGVIIGQYYSVRSPIHALDPRTKILASIILIVVLFMANNFQGFLVSGLFSLAVIWLSKVPFRLIVRGLRPVIFILGLTIILNLFMTPGDELFTLGYFTGTRQGLIQGVFIALRLIILITSTSLLTLTTSPISLTDGLESLLKPFSKIGVPAHELAMMMTIALRFIPTLIDEADKIMKAQMARGADFETGNIFRRAKSLVPLLVPLFVGAFRRADELAMAMEARCYRGGENRTRLKELKMFSRDVFAFGIVILMVTGVLYSRSAFPPLR